MANESGKWRVFENEDDFNAVAGTLKELGIPHEVSNHRVEGPCLRVPMGYDTYLTNLIAQEGYDATTLKCD